ncbi:hypothetical protein ABH926_001111 [Catenulispora sp. GP43]|uniref:Tat pathway signal sequence domain protein n=1 Tax=Catenulispora sp. GP43 TaxID=3156263 RepID=UPI0035171035
MRSRTLALTIAAAVGLVLGAAGQAGAATGGVLTVGSAGGTNVNVGDSLAGAINSDFIFTTGSGTIDCSSGQFTAGVTANPAVGGNATESITQLHADPANCTTTVSGTIGVVSVEINGPATGTVVGGTTSTLKVTGLDEQVTLSSFLGNVTCDYGTTGSVTEIDGSLSNTDNSISFATQNVNLISGSGLCPSSGTFQGGVGPVLDTTQSSQATFVN